MNPLEKSLLDFLLNQARNNPQLAGQLMGHLFDQLKSNPALQQDIIAFIEQLLPVLLQNVKVG